MTFIDAILNLACLLLWMNWRSLRVPRTEAASGVTLGSTLKPIKRGAGRTVSSFSILLGILFFRGLFYHQLGSSVNWMPVLNLGATVLRFRSDHLPRILLFSFLGFGIWLFWFHAWLLLISALARQTAEATPFQRLARAHLGPLARWPIRWKLAAAPVAGFLLSMALHPIMVRTGLLPEGVSFVALLFRAVSVALAVPLVWKYLLIALFLAHLANSYLYLGESPVWPLATEVCQRLLHPLRHLPLRVGRMDFSPLLGIAIVVAAAEMLRFWLPKVYRLF